jgi:hypothetical protein
MGKAKAKERERRGRGGGLTISTKQGTNYSLLHRTILLSIRVLSAVLAYEKLVIALFSICTHTAVLAGATANCARVRRFRLTHSASRFTRTGAWCIHHDPCSYHRHYRWFVGRYEPGEQQPCGGTGTYTSHFFLLRYGSLACIRKKVW